MLQKIKALFADAEGQKALVNARLQLQEMNAQVRELESVLDSLQGREFVYAYSDLELIKGERDILATWFETYDYSTELD